MNMRLRSLVMLALAACGAKSVGSTASSGAENTGNDDDATGASSTQDESESLESGTADGDDGDGSTSGPGPEDTGESDTGWERTECDDARSEVECLAIMPTEDDEENWHCEWAVVKRHGPQGCEVASEEGRCIHFAYQGAGCGAARICGDVIEEDWIYLHRYNRRVRDGIELFEAWACSWQPTSGWKECFWERESGDLSTSSPAACECDCPVPP